MNTQELFAKFETLCEAFKAEHEGKSKAAQARARKIAGEIKYLDFINIFLFLIK